MSTKTVKEHEKLASELSRVALNWHHDVAPAPQPIAADFEASTVSDISRLKQAVDQLYVFNMLLIVMLCVLILIGSWMLLPLVVANG